MARHSLLVLALTAAAAVGLPAAALAAPPTVTAPVVAGATGGWAGPGATVTYGGTNDAGIRKIELLDGETVVASKEALCPDWNVLPCAEAGAGGGVALSTTATIPSLGLTGGVHSLTTRATDAGGALTVSAATAVNIDTTVPIATGLSGGGASPAQTRSLTWASPAGGSPIVGARVQLCRGPAEPLTQCDWQTVAPDGTLGFDIGADGTLATAAVELTDAAGNVGTTPAIAFRRDATAPAAPSLIVLSTTAGRNVITVKSSSADATSYLVHVCHAGSCTDRRQGATGTVVVELPTLGAYSVDVTLLDDAGNASLPTFVTLTNAGSGTAGGLTPGGTPLATKLAAKIAAKLGKTTMVVKGTVAAGSTTKITVTLSGKRRGSKKAVVTRDVVTPNAAGAWALRLPLPKRIVRKTGVLVTVVATPNTGYAKTVVRKRVRG